MGCGFSLAEETTQEAFLRLHRALGEGLEIRNARAWLFRVARNLYVDSRRDHHRLSTTGPDEWDALAWARDEFAADPEKLMLEQERIRLITAEMLRLPELQRRCMHLKAQGLRYHEIAALLDIPMTSAVDCVRRAVKRLGKTNPSLNRKRDRQ